MNSGSSASVPALSERNAVSDAGCRRLVGSGRFVRTARHLQALEKTDRDNQVYPRDGTVESRRLGRARDGGSARLISAGIRADTYRSEIQAPWFAYHLKGKGKSESREATIFQSGSNRWMKYDSWTPRAECSRNAILSAGGRTNFHLKNRLAKMKRLTVMFPIRRIRFRIANARFSQTYGQGSTWFILARRRPAFSGSDRKDVLSWQSDVLTEDVTVTGDIIAHLFASTTGSDSDWVVKLIDVYPAENPADEKMANYQLMVASEILRGRYRQSFEKAEAIEPNKVNEYTIDMRGNNYTFKKGHRMMVQVQSTWFPLYDRNPQKFVENIFLAKEEDFQKATQQIYRSAKYPSHISVSVAAR